MTRFRPEPPVRGPGGRIRLRPCRLALAGAALLAPLTARAQDDLPVRPVIRGLEFVGNRALDDYRLRISIVTSNSSWWVTFPLVSWLGLGEKRYFDEREFQRDVVRLQLRYSQAGYLDARVDTLVRRDDHSVYVRFLITEGEPVRVGELTVTGLDSIPNPGDVTRDLALRVGDPFDRFRLRAATDTLVTRLHNLGYAFAEVFRGFEVDREAHRAVVSLDVVTGARATVAAVEVEGARAVGPSLVRRLIPVRTGRYFRDRDIYATQFDLYRTGIYDYVDARVVDSVPDSPTDSTVTVRVRVREGKLNRVRLGAGNGTLDCFRLLGGWTAHHALGGARALDLSARLSKIGTGEPFSWGLEHNLCAGLRNEQDSSRLALNYNVTASLTEPILFVRGTTGALSLFAERRSELQAFVRQAVGGEVSVSRRVFGDVPVTARYRLERGSTRAEPATFCVFLNICRDEDISVFEGPFIQASVGLLAIHNHQNSALNPSRGSLTSAEVQWAAPAVGSDTLAQFTKLQGQYALYLPIGRRGALAWRVQYGTLLAASPTLTGQNLRYVPPDERFYGGGPNSVRGYGQNELGPVVRVLQDRTDGSGSLVTDTLTSASGGNDLFFANVELRVPLPAFSGRLQGAVFVDAGQIQVRGSQTFAYDGLRVTPGAGLRLDTALGPIRLDLGYNGYRPAVGPLYRREGAQLQLVDDSFAPERPSSFFRRLRLHFSVGQAF